MARVRGAALRFTEDRTGWRSDAACAGHDPEVWYPTSISDRSETALRAKRICVECPVRLECAGWAERTGDDWGILAGFTPRERRLLKRRGVPLTLAPVDLGAGEPYHRRKAKEKTEPKSRPKPRPKPTPGGPCSACRKHTLNRAHPQSGTRYCDDCRPVQRALVSRRSSAKHRDRLMVSGDLAEVGGGNR